MADASSLNILSIGGSRNIGYYSSLHLLNAGATVTFLLRDPSTFDNDERMGIHIRSGNARIVKGDALVKDDVASAWVEAIRDRSGGRVDFLLFTVGGTPHFHLTKGFTISPPNLVTQCLLNVLCTLPTPAPKIITISSTGLTKTSHSSLPLPLKPLYGYLLTGPHDDKLGAERVIHHVTSGWSWNYAADGDPADNKTILPEGWANAEGLPKEGSLKGVLVIRPSMLTDGDSVAEKRQGSKEGQKKAKAPYRVSTEKELGGYTVSRKDVAHFVAEVILKRWAEFEDKIVNISY